MDPLAGFLRRCREEIAAGALQGREREGHRVLGLILVEGLFRSWFRRVVFFCTALFHSLVQEGLGFRGSGTALGLRVSDAK